MARRLSAASAADIVVDATQAWREEGDPLFAFIKSRLTACPHGFAFLQVMLDDFNGTLPKPEHALGCDDFRSAARRAPGNEGARRRPGNHPRNRKSGFKGVEFA